MKIKLVFAILVALLLSACGTTEPLVRYKDLAGFPPDALLQDCEVTRPPLLENYLASDWAGREDLLTKSNVAQYKAMAKCNKDKASLRKWKADKQQLIEQQSKPQ